MELDLTADQELFRATTRRFLEREAATARLRDWAKAGVGFDREMWAKGAELGWTSLLVPEDLNGGSVSEAPLVDLGIIAEELGLFAAPWPLATTSVVVLALAHSNAAHHAEALAGIMSGSTVATWAIYEPSKGWDPRGVETAAQQQQGGFRLNGVKDRVEAGDQADLFLVTARLDGQLAQFLVSSTTPGVKIKRVWSLDFNRHYATITLDNVVVPKESMVGEVGNAADMIERQCQTMFALQCAETCGVCNRVFDVTLQWTFDRFSFGRQLASYQAIKHRFATMKTYLEAMHAATQGALRTVQARAADAPTVSRAANLFVCDQAVKIIQDCVQIHGGIGVTWEHDLHIYLRRATVNRALFGTPDEQRQALSYLLAA